MLNNSVSSKDRFLDKYAMCIRVSAKLICFIETFTMMMLFEQFLYTLICLNAKYDIVYFDTKTYYGFLNFFFAK